MPVEHRREGNVCERCKKPDTEVGKITHYTKRGADLLLCPKCLEKREKPYTEKCQKCKRVAYEHGGLTYYDDSDADDVPRGLESSDNSDDYYNDLGFDDKKPPNFDNVMCMECYEKKLAKAKKIRKAKLTIKNFAKDHWKFWITISVAILAIIIGLPKL